MHAAITGFTNHWANTIYDYAWWDNFGPMLLAIWQSLAVFFMEKKQSPGNYPGLCFCKSFLPDGSFICPNVGFKAGVPENFGNLYTLQKLVVYMLRFNNCVLKSNEFSWVFKPYKDVQQEYQFKNK